MRIGLAAAGGKNLEVFSPTIGRQLLELGLIDETRGPTKGYAGASGDPAEFTSSFA